MLSDIEIANAAILRPIRKVAAETLGIAERHLVPYGHYKAKVDPTYLATLADRSLGRLVLVTALSPTPPGEGKTTTTVGLTDALHGLGHRTVACLREPSMGPVFGMKGARRAFCSSQPRSREIDGLLEERLNSFIAPHGAS